jgi:CBS domain-containing protein
MATLHDILENKGRTIYKTRADATVREAVAAMSQARVGALLVTEAEQPVGIFSERDVLARVILEGRSPETTAVGDVMTEDVVCISMAASPEQAMAVMTERRVRHLPVVLDRKLVGLVSIGDLVRWASQQQKYEVEMLRDYLAGRYA